jgi:hypothetical protein
VKRWLVLTLIAAALLYGFAVDPVLDVNGDPPRFVMLARSIHDWQGYVARFDIQDHVETQIPYLYPLLLVPVISVFGAHAYVAFKLFSTACMLLALVAMWFWLSQWTSQDEAKWVTITAAFLAQTQLNAVHISTEAPFLASSFACLGFMEKATRESGRLRDWILTFILMAVSFHLRVAAWALAVTLIAALFLRGLWKKAMISTAFAFLACLPWLVRIFIYGFGYSSEFEQNTSGFLSLLWRITYNGAADVAKALPDLFLYPYLSKYMPYEPVFFLKAAIGSVFFILMARGLWLYAEKRHYVGKASPSAIYLIVYLIGALSWTVHGERYLLPVLPILLLALFRGAAPMSREVMAVLIAIGIGGCFAGIYQAQTGARTSEEAGFIEAGNWLKRNSPGSDRVMSRYPTWIAADNGQRGERFDESFDPEVHHQVLLKDHIRWLVVDYNKMGSVTPAEYLEPLLSKYSDQFELKYQSQRNPPTRVYKFLGTR